MAATPQPSRRKPRRRTRRWAWPGAGRVLRALGRLVRGVLAATVLAALLGGLPWALTHFVGWPLPDHLPSWAELQGVLLGPMTTTFLLDFLACLTWLVWAFFTLDVARCAVEIARDARMPDLSAAGPVHRIAAVLVGAVLISILGQRAGLPATSPAAGGAAAEVVATAPAWSTPSEQGKFAVVRPAAYSAPEHNEATGAVEQPSRAKSAVVLPYNPDTGVYDSLWRMSERTLGDGNRWPEIYALNKGKPQPNGGTFTQPGLIFPGEEMALPDDATVSSPPATAPVPPPITPPPAPELPPSSTTTPRPSTTQRPATSEALPTTQAPPATQAPPSTGAVDEPGISWGEELFVGLGLAAAVSAALVAARRRNRRRYQPGSGDRSDLPVAPVVYQLRLAHLRADHDTTSDDEIDLDWPTERPPRAPAPPLVLGTHADVPDVLDDQAPVLPVGVRDGREIAVDLADAHGLGLLGAGAPAAVRALLVAILSTAATTTQRPATVIVPADDLAALFGRRVAQAPLPAGVRVAADLDAALDMLESETLVRVGQLTSTGQPWEPVVLAARAPGRQARRLQAVLDNGSTVGVTGLLLGQWSAGVTAYVRDDGTISTTSPGFGEPLRGARVFRLGDDHLADLLDLLRHADPDPGHEPELSEAAVDEPRPAAVPRPHVVVDDPVPFTVEPPDTVVDRDARPDDRGPAGSENTIQAPVADTDLELLAAPGDDGRRSDGELEILGPELAPATSPGIRLRPVKSLRSDADQATQNAGESHRHGRPSGSKPQGPAEPHEASSAPLRVSVLGPPRVWWRSAPATPDGETAEREITSAFQPRLRELLVFLALHPDGASREALIAALWATSPPERTTNAMNTALSRLRRAVAAATGNVLSDLVVVGEGRYRLDPELVEVDYHHFAAAVAARRAAVTDADRVEAYRRIVDSYTGPLADGLSTDWIETAREAIRRDAIDAVAALARALVEDDPQQTLDLLEIARAFDPHNELIYRDIMRLQERLGQLDAIPRTLTLLTTRLAEVDDRPTHQAVDLADRLRRRHDAPGEPGRADRGHSRAG
ncbi:DNA-binding SARP family transcriptional activator [Lentzea atacamensis]|uniref:DNA-binding SARP family transcriptional activator n=1 Tax=Lentzea atacamensis TaxID=531938 RepID=A0A316HWK2_9PSEU|nr:BTAD domain-containing putative transcriptional regulator [Lentzea atacamensis]PWK84503.1 DNA-binding SARP family transcriptional activator [Lentzea atacamensis]